MLAEGFQRIADFAQAAHRLEVVTVPDLRKVLVRTGEDVEDFDLPPVPRGGELLGVDDLVAAATDGDFAKAPEVYHDTTAVRLVVDRGDRHEVVTMSLMPSKRFLLLESLAAEGKTRSPRELIRMLRFDLPVSGATPLMNALRRVDFSRSSAGYAQTEHGKESLGRSVEAAVQQADQVPQTFVATVPVYQNPGLVGITSVDVELGVHIDLDEQAILVKPLADELCLALQRAQQAIGVLFRQRLPNVPVFYGRPNHPLPVRK